MEEENKIQKGNIVETALEIAPFAVALLDPETVSNPTKLLIGVGQAIATHFLSKLSSEYKMRVASNELKDKDFVTEKPPLILSGLLRIIDEGKIDEEKFRAMKSIFFFC